VYFVTQDLVTTTQGFWRATPGEPLLAQEQRWTNQEPVEYSFYLHHMLSFFQGVRGTVRVLNGTVAKVTNVLDDRTLLPIANPDLSQFLTIRQLFEEIGRAFKSGAQQVQVCYDPSGLYPERILVNPSVLIADDESEFEVSEFVVLQP
jgi:hypothetical protein